MEDGKGRYMVEVLGLSPSARWDDVYHFFLNCGTIMNLDITRMSADMSIAHVEFADAYSVKIALFLTGSEIADQPVSIYSCGTYNVDPSPYLFEISEPYSTATYSVVTCSDAFVSNPVEAVTVVQQVVQTMISKGYVLSKDAVSKAKAFDERFHVYDMTKTAATYTGKTAVAAANAVVNSSYFAKGALWVSDVLDRASKAAADLGNRNIQNDDCCLIFQRALSIIISVQLLQVITLSSIVPLLWMNV